MFITNVDNYLMICEYVYIFKYAIVALLISCLLFFLSVFAVYQKPEKEKLLRWYYGKEREALSADKREKAPYISFLTLNFLIHKSLFKQVHFNEDIPNLRHEDTLFSFNLKQLQIPIKHINNPIYHLGLDTFENAIHKEHESLFALKNLIDQNLITSDYTKLLRVFQTIQKCKLGFIITWMYQLTKSIFLK